MARGLHVPAPPAPRPAPPRAPPPAARPADPAASGPGPGGARGRGAAPAATRGPGAALPRALPRKGRAPLGVFPGARGGAQKAGERPALARRCRPHRRTPESGGPPSNLRRARSGRRVPAGRPCL